MPKEQERLNISRMIQEKAVGHAKIIGREPVGINKMDNDQILCSQCGKPMEGDGHYVSWAYAHGEEKSWLIKHLVVGRYHFCDRKCFEQYRDEYWRKLENKSVNP